MTNRVNIFGEIAKVAWQSRLLQIAQSASKGALIGTWDAVKDAELCILQV